MYGVHSLVPGSRGFFRMAQFLILLTAAAMSVAADETARPPGLSLNKDPIAETPYVGDEECRSCHQNLVRTYHLTAHYLTSRPPTKDSISGRFTPGSNVL